MKLRGAYLFLLLCPLLGYCQHMLSFGGEMSGVYKNSENIRPFDAYRLLGPIVQLSHRSDSSKLQTTLQSGFSWVKSSSWSDVYSIPLNAGFNYRLMKDQVYGLTGAAGIRFMFSNDADKARFLLSFRIGIYYDLFKGVPFKIGYERIGNSNAIFAQLIVYGFVLGKK